MEDSEPAVEIQSYISVENLLLLNQLSHQYIITQLLQNKSPNLDYGPNLLFLPLNNATLHRGSLRLEDDPVGSSCFSSFLHTQNTSHLNVILHAYFNHHETSYLCLIKLS